MEQDYCIKRFFEECYTDMNMYQEYLNKEAFINQEKYLEWLSELNERNKTFAEAISQLYLIRKKDEIVESVLSREMTSAEYLNVRTSVPIVREFIKPSTIPQSISNKHFHYICNGYYSDTLSRIYEVLNGGAFTVGICCDKKARLYKEIKSYYEKLKANLLTKGYVANNAEVNIDCYKVYILNYRYKGK